MPINEHLWEQIVLQAKTLGIPSLKKRGIIREYLQSQLLSQIYALKESRCLVFTGGTALRLLYNNKRLSEDLDFDVTKKDFPIKEFMAKIYQKQKNEYNLEYVFKHREEGAIAYLKYKDILQELEISPFSQEKIIIKFDFSFPEDSISPTVKLLNRFGFLERVLTYDLSTLLSFKIRAFFTRRMERGRDLYDITTLVSQNVLPNLEIMFFKRKRIKTYQDLANLILSWYEKNKKLIPRLKNQIKPFLINEEEAKYLDLLPLLLKEKFK